ncbi:MAG: SPOR domain-containing protein [Oceanococcus sp.]
MRFSRKFIALITLQLSVFATAGQAVSFPAASGVLDYARIVELGCNFEFRSGWEFEFPSADPVLQPYGFILWKNKPSIVSNPLDYSLHQGRRGKLTGELVVRDGIRWYTGVMDDCTRIYAEDASTYSKNSPLEHLIFHGKVFFADTYAAAQSLIGHDVIVQGAGLEPRQRLYTPDRRHYFPLQGGQVLRVVGIDTHRYAHTKGVGPFFLVVENADQRRGLIKYNPEYLRVPHGVLPVYVRAPGREFANNELPGRKRFLNKARQGNHPIPGDDAYVLTLNRFRRESDGLNAVAELELAGFSAYLMPPENQTEMLYELRVEGFSSAGMAESMARILANRFGWIELAQPLNSTPSVVGTGRR